MEEIGLEEWNMMDMLIEWFETIEELELSESDKSLLSEIAQSLEASRASALEMGIQDEDFQEWLRLDVLEQWSFLCAESEDDEEMGYTPVQAFHAFAKGGEQRLYLQMLKQCAPVTISQLA